MPKLYVTFLWHQHQPYYMDPETGHFAMPWVRLHAIKDYIGMANLLAEFPRLRQVINFVPSLVRQIQEYVAGETDLALTVSRIPADSLTAAHVNFILDTFFMANWERMVNPHPRYRQLLARRDFSRKTAAAAARKFSADDLRDLQVWSNLAWFHPTVVEKDPDLQALIHKDRGFTEQEKILILDKQLKIMADIIPLHRRLAEAGQLELTSTPFFHPIIPLLCDASKARVAIPGLPLPEPMLTSPEDAAAQIQNAVACHQQVFGARPRGMWPSEGSVSDDAAALFAQAGIDWIATDEEILAQTLGITFTRDKSGLVDRPAQLYKPYSLTPGGRPLSIVFRDHELSDLVGFRYYMLRPRKAAEDLIARLEDIRSHAPDNSLVTIALDGENCWEHYENQGVEFLRQLYDRLSHAKDIETIRTADYIDRHEPAQNLPHIFPGSWIAHNFATWIGHWEKNRAWEYLARARNAYETLAPSLPPDKRTAVLQELYIAEGSDWFWWYGDDHTSGNDAEFDSLFRKHLRQVYQLLGLEPPAELFRPIIDTAVRESWRPPRGLLNVTVDGRRTSFFEWLGSGVYDQTLDSGAMQRAESAPVTALYFGFSIDSLFLRLDPAEPDWKLLQDLTVELWMGDADQPAVSVRFTADAVQVVPPADPASAPVHAARRRIIEIGVQVEL